MAPHWTWAAVVYDHGLFVRLGSFDEAAETAAEYRAIQAAGGLVDFVHLEPMTERNRKWLEGVARAVERGGPIHKPAWRGERGR
jgi:hypothetical protein